MKAGSLCSQKKGKNQIKVECHIRMFHWGNYCQQCSEQYLSRPGERMGDNDFLGKSSGCVQDGIAVSS